MGIPLCSQMKSPLPRILTLMAAKDDDALIYVPDTGEVLLGKNRYEKLMACKDDPSTSGKNEGEIRVTYQKDHWVKGDLRPEHYFACTSTDADQKSNEI